MIANEVDELQEGILAYWETLDQDGEPTAEWKRWVWQMLFGLPLLADGEKAHVPLSHPAWVIAEGVDTGAMIFFHLKFLADNPTGPIARRLWERVYKLSGDALAAMDTMDSREGAA